MVMSADPFTSELAAALATDLLARFERYARIGTQARRDRERSPSTPGQLELARMLTAELQEVGLDDAALDDNGYVTATLAGAPGAPTIGLIAHVDTSPDAPADGVEPIVHRDYDGGVIELPRGGTRLDPATMPELTEKRGHDIVTSSGDTLLGADDKAGVAAIMAAVAHLTAHPELPRPTLRIAFTPDEEIGEGAKLFDIERFGALCAYTIDGSDLGELQDETFSADEAIVRDHRGRGSPREGDRQARQRAPARGAGRRRAAGRSPDAGDDERPRGLHPPVPDDGRRRHRRRSASSSETSTTTSWPTMSRCSNAPPARSPIVSRGPGSRSTCAGSTGTCARTSTRSRRP